MKLDKEKYTGLRTERISVESASLLDASRATMKSKTRSTNWMEESSPNKEFGIDEMAIPATGNRQDYWSTEF